MIQLTKRTKPTKLASNGSNWTSTLMSLVNSNAKIPDHVWGQYREDDIKKVVKEETGGKCVYCETYVTHQYPGDIEHIIPKSKYPRLTFIWSNLTFVCYWCNNHKRDYVEKGEAKLLNPYKDQIKEHLVCAGPLLMHINGSKRGELTSKIIKLNRKDIVDRRIDKMNELQSLIDKYERENVIPLKELLRQELIEFTYSENEYSYMCFCYLSSIGLM